MPLSGWVLLGVGLLLTIPFLIIFLKDKFGYKSDFYGDKVNRESHGYNEKDESYEKSSLHMKTGQRNHLGNGGSNDGI